jgi:hypothetical protein
MAGEDELKRSDIILRMGDGSVVAAIPQFGLFARGPSVEAALSALEEKRAALQGELAAFSALRDEPAAQPASPPVRWGEIKQFAIKAAIVFALTIAAVMYTVIKLDETVQSTAYRLQMQVQGLVALGSETFGQKLERELERAASPEHELPADKKQKLLAELHTVVERWRPFAAEAMAIFPPQPAPTGPRAP